MWGHLTIYHCWPGRGPAAACSHQETSGGGGGVITRSDLRDGLLGQAEADPLLDSAPPGLLGDQDRPLVVVRHPDWSEQGAAGAVPGISSSVRCTLVLCCAPSVPQLVVQSRRRPLLGPSPG